MKRRIAQLNEIAPRRIRKQAALWVTELHSPDRDAALEDKVRRWIAEDPRHAAAFELATEAWQRSGNLPGYLPERAPDALPRRRARSKASGPALIGMAILCAAVISAVYFLREGTLVTGPAEQRTVELSDGTEVSLNANSRVVIQYDDHVRKVTLAKGEVLFDVIKHQPRPFVVVIGDRKVIAMGTSFLVRREEPTGSAFAVTLVEGRVAIEPISWPDALPSGPAPGLNLLNPGERLRFAAGATEKIDLPSIERVTAWQRSQLIFDDTSLNEAAAEFNRYGSNRLVIDGPALGKLRVGGVFRIGDPLSFAQAMANGYHLRIINKGNTILLTDKRPDAK
jgi:transmembrane sensor